jgi:large subunit ribosomal protein L4e
MSMKVNVYGLNGEIRGKLDTVNAFSLKVRPDLIKRAVLAEQSKRRQAYGADPLAGKRTSAHYHGRRAVFQSMMNREMARMKRIHGSGFLSMRARFVPQAVKGRKAHPPKAEKNWELRINKKERMKALFSAVSASADREIVSEHGHRIEKVKQLPVVLEDGFSGIKKTKDVETLFLKLGLGDEIERLSGRKIRAGRGKTRGRKHIRKRGPVIVIKEDKGIIKAAKNLAGFDVMTVKDLTVESMAPGAVPGRLAIYTKSALQEMEKMI